MKNTKKIIINVPNEVALNRIKNTPTFSRLSRLNLVLGENIETVNHKQYYDMLRLYPLIGVSVNVLNGC